MNSTHFEIPNCSLDGSCRKLLYKTLEYSPFQSSNSY
ncbi:hypothetical protein ABKN59_008920 [Abortiporus biennis]